MHTVEVIFEIAGEQQKGKRVVYGDGLFREMTDIKLMKITLPLVDPPKVTPPQADRPTVSVLSAEIPQVEVPVPRFPEQRYPEIQIQALNGPGVRFQEGEDFAIITMDGAILFDFDKYDLRSDDLGTLLQMLSLLTSRYPDAPLEIHGHTDSVGTDDYNQTLSERRADAVKDWLERNGWPSDRLRSVGFGKSTPVAPNFHLDGSYNSEGRQKNRRVEVIIHKTSAEHR